MQAEQLELWKPTQRAPLQTPPLYQELTPDQRHELIERLARLMLQQALNNSTLTTIADHHER